MQASLHFLLRLTAKCHHGLPGPYVSHAYRLHDDGPLGRSAVASGPDLRRWPIAKTASGAVHGVQHKCLGFRPWQVERFPKNNGATCPQELLQTRGRSRPGRGREREPGRVAGCTLQACDSKARKALEIWSADSLALESSFEGCRDQ